MIKSSMQNVKSSTDLTVGKWLEIVFFWQVLRGEPTATTLYTDNLSEDYMWLYRIKFNAQIMLGCMILSLLAYFINKYLMPSEVMDFIFRMSAVGAVGVVITTGFLYINYLFLKRRKD